MKAKEANLRAELFELTQEARIETIRLSGLLSICNMYGKGKEEHEKFLDSMFEKYVKNKVAV